MNQLIENRKPTMSSRAIAEVVESRHDNVKRTMETLRDRSLITFTQTEEKTSGRPAVIYHVGKRDSYVVVAQLCPEFTARLVDRWQELEALVDQPSMPTNYIEALEHLLEAKKSEQRALAQAEAAKPALEFMGRYVETGNTKSIRETAKILGLPEKAFIQAMIDDKVLYRQSGNLLPHQKHHVAERFEVKTGERNGHAYTQTRVTSAGIDYLARFYGHWVGEVAA